MKNPLRPIFEHPSVQQFFQWWKETFAPVWDLWIRIWTPVAEALEPVNAFFKRLFAPVARTWNTFEGRYPWPARFIRWGGLVAFLGILALSFIVFLVGIGSFGRIPNSNELKNIDTANATEIYSVDSVLIGKFYIENRTAISVDRISPHIINALIATEDKRFFEHSGIDLYSWGRVVYGMMTGQRHAMGGGSTLSQQLAKNLYPRQRHKVFGTYFYPVSLLINKIREYFISVKLERIYSKEELLGLYLNTVPFGGDLFGISVASKYYFNRKAKDLSPGQAATLIGMLKATTYYNPVRNPENARRRRNIVLRQMVNNGHLSEAEYKELSEKPVGAASYNKDGNNEGIGTYFREHLRTSVMPGLLRQIENETEKSYNLYTDGLKIYTTLHSGMQRYAEEAVKEHMQELQNSFDKHWKGYTRDKPWGDDRWIEETVRRSDRWRMLKENDLNPDSIRASFETPVPMTIFSWENGGSEVDTVMSPIDSVRYYYCLLNCGFIAMDHHNGHIKAWVGGTNFRHFKFDHIKSARQVGSTFKPIVYSAALKDSIMPCSYIPNELVLIKDWEPHNYDDVYGGWYSVAAGLQKSVNVVAAQLIERVGIQRTLDHARSMGVTANLPREYGISLGACEISLYDMAKVYGTIANDGVRPEPVTVLKVTSREGKTLYDYNKELAKNPELGPHEQALNKDQAAIMRKMMQNVIYLGTGRRLLRYVGGGSDFAGKTGTTQNQADGWFMCFNPHLVTGSWVGGETRAVRFRSMALGQGAAMALPIVGRFWQKLAQDKKYRSLVYSRFPPLTPEVAGRFGCPNWIGVHPDTLELFRQDSVLYDTLVAHNFEAFDGYEELLFEPDAMAPPNQQNQALPDNQLPTPQPPNQKDKQPLPEPKTNTSIKKILDFKPKPQKPREGGGDGGGGGQ